MENLETATLCGVSPLEFWELTPYELSLIIKAYVKRKEEESKERISLAYINAMWTIQWLGKKSNHPKPLKEILDSIGKEKKVMTDEQMLAVVKSLNAALGGEVNENKKPTI